MSSSYTSRLGLELQADGENSNTWGQRLNSSVISLLDTAIAGITSVALSSVPVSLSKSDGSADQSRSAILYLHGVLTSNCQVVVPSVTKPYVVWNAATGNFNPVIKTAGAAGQPIPRGSLCQVFRDSVSVWIGRTSVGNSVLMATDASAARSAIGAGTGSGTVTSVAVSAGVGVSVAGSPITAAGSIAVRLDIDKLTTLTSVTGSTDYVPVYNASASTPNKASPDVLARGWVLLQSKSASSSSTIDFTGLDDTYDEYEVFFDNVIPVTDAQNFSMRVGTGAGPAYIATTSYSWGLNGMGSAGTSNVQDFSSSSDRIALNHTTTGVGNATGESISGSVNFCNPEGVNSTDILFETKARYIDPSGNVRWLSGGGHYDGSAITALRFFFNSGILSGTFRLYGLRK